MKRLLICLLSFQLFANQPNPCVTGVGACAIDLLIQVDDAFITQHVTNRRGASCACTSEIMDEVLSKAKLVPKLAPGGSAANTICALAKMGEPCAFLSHVGADHWGTIFCDHLRALEVDLRLKQAPFTARVLCLISPDGQRTFLGLDPQLEDLSTSKEDLQNTKWIHFEARDSQPPLMLKGSCS